MRALGIKLEFIYYNTPEQNGHVESFHKTLKKEYLWCQDFKNYQEAEIAMSSGIQRLQPEQDSLGTGLQDSIRVLGGMDRKATGESVTVKSMSLQTQKVYQKWRDHSNLYLAKDSWKPEEKAQEWSSRFSQFLDS